MLEEMKKHFFPCRKKDEEQGELMLSKRQHSSLSALEKYIWLIRRTTNNVELEIFS